MGCSPNKPSTPASTPATTTTAATAASPIASSPTASLPAGDEDCTRGDATPVLDAAKVAGYAFHRGIGSRAEEVATLADGVSLRILHTGCAHYVERFVFVTKGDAPSGKDVLARAAKLVKSLPVRGDRAASAAQWADLLSARAAAAPAYVAGEEIVVIPDFSWLSVTEKTVPGGTELEVVYDIAL